MISLPNKSIAFSLGYVIQYVMLYVLRYLRRFSCRVRIQCSDLTSLQI